MEHSYTIFLIDDDRFLLDMYALKFKNAGHTVHVFENGQEAIAALKEGTVPNAFLIDIVMPVMNGFETIAAIKKDALAPNAKIIMLTNQGQDEDLERAKQLNVDGYIIKASAIPSEVYTETISIIEKATHSVS